MSDQLRITILPADTSSHEELPLTGSSVKAGFPSPADERGWLLMPANPKYQPLRIDDRDDLRIWGVVTYIIKRAH